MALGLIRRRPGELPEDVTGFVGRQAELSQLTTQLREARLVTVTGPGGVGKTRVALRAARQVADGFADGVCLVELSCLHDPELLPHTVATCLGLPECDPRSQLDALLEYLRGKRLLLIMDTCEHLLDACAMLADVVLRETGGVTMLATSRQPLDVPGEHARLIPPLPVPDPDDEPAAADGGANGDAVELFAQRAATIVPGFAVTAANRTDVIRLCRRLDGIPLAIELATVRLRALPLEELAERLEHRFQVLTGGRRTAIPRHQTLHTTIEWSYDLCSPAEKLLWTRLSVFADAFDVAAAEDVCAGGDLDSDDMLETLIALVDKSVVLRVEHDGATRYRLLDTIREFGAEQLADHEHEVRSRHLARYLAMAARFDEHLLDDQQLPLYRELRREHADIRAALEYALSTPGREDVAADLARLLYGYWDISGLLREGKHWMTKILERFPDASPQRAWALILRGFLSTFQGETIQAIADLEAGTPMAEQTGETLWSARGQVMLTLAFIFTGRHQEAAAMGELAEQSAQNAGDELGLLFMDAQLGYLHLIKGDPDQALTRCASGLARLGAGSGERLLQSWLQLVTAFALLVQGSNDEAMLAACRALEMKHELGDILGMAFCIEGLSWHAAGVQRNERAAWLLGAADTLWRRGGIRLSGDPVLEEFHAGTETAVCAALGPERYTTLWRRGALHPLEQVIALAADDADEIGPPAAQPPVALGAPAESLTHREREIAALVSEGLSNREIAQRLVISKRTVDAHVEHIFGKLGISSRVQLVISLRPDETP
jgi:predicted ATPase/DNA-binding CsgD family transcriptional regulator